MMSGLVITNGLCIVRFVLVVTIPIMLRVIVISLLVGVDMMILLFVRFLLKRFLLVGLTLLLWC